MITEVERIFAAIEEHKEQYKEAYEALKMYWQFEKAMRIIDLLEQAPSVRMYVDTKTRKIER